MKGKTQKVFKNIGWKCSSSWFAGDSALRDDQKIVDLGKVKTNHHTDMFDEPFMILRRGFWVDFLVDLNTVDLVKTINVKATTDLERLDFAKWNKWHNNWTVIFSTLLQNYSTN